MYHTAEEVPSHQLYFTLDQNHTAVSFYGTFRAIGIQNLKNAERSQSWNVLSLVLFCSTHNLGHHGIRITTAALHSTQEASWEVSRCIHGGSNAWISFKGATPGKPHAAATIYSNAGERRMQKVRQKEDPLRTTVSITSLSSWIRIDSI